MKKIAQELKALPHQQLLERLKEQRKELMKMRVQLATGAAAVNSGKLRQGRKNIARLQSLLAQKEGI